jgi:hypothetical protein
MLFELAIDSPYPASPERIPPPPRRVAWNSKARWLRTAAWASLLFAPNIILLCSWQAGEDLRALVARGQRTFGRVDDVHMSSSRGGRSYRVQYTYEVAGASYHARTIVRASEVASFSRGHQCLVTYLPDQPKTNFPGRPGPELERRNETAVAFALLAVIGLAVWVICLEYAVRRELYLAREGEPAVGRVIERGSVRSKNQIHYWVRHHFKSATNEHVSDWHYVPSSLWGTLRPGLAITLLYDPEQPRRHLPLYAFKYAYIVEETEADDATAETG